MKKQTGGRVVKPSEYYGHNSGRYYSAGSPELTPCNSAYGKTRAVSFGNINSSFTETGPNLGPYPGSSGKMTGGGKNKSKNMKKKLNKKSKSKSKSNSKKSKKQSGGNKKYRNLKKTKKCKK